MKNFLGLPKQGILQLRMCSGDGMALNDCKPDVSLRRMLLHHVLVSHQDICFGLRSLAAKQSPRVIFEDEEFSRKEKDEQRIIQRQLQLQEGAQIYSLNDSIQHLATKTPIKWTYFGASATGKSRPSTSASEQPRKNRNRG